MEAAGATVVASRKRKLEKLSVKADSEAKAIQVPGVDSNSMLPYGRLYTRVGGPWTSISEIVDEGMKWEHACVKWEAAQLSDESSDESSDDDDEPTEPSGSDRSDSSSDESDGAPARVTGSGNGSSAGHHDPKDLSKYTAK